MKIMKTAFFVFIFLLLSISAMAQQAASVTLTVAKPTLVSGDVTNATIDIKNVQVLAATFTISATGTWLDAHGTQYTTTAVSAPIQITKPITVSTISIPIPSTLTYVANSANIGGTAVPATLSSGTLTITVNRVLNEQEFVDVVLQLKAN
jgi:hypothetical protein